MGRPKKDVGSVSGGEDVIKNVMGSLMNSYSKEVFNHIQNERIRIPTGSLILDYYVNLRSGSIVRFGGPLESGKTSQSLLIMSNYLKTIPKSRGLYIKSEGRLSEEMQKRSGLKFVYNQNEWEYGTVFVLESNIYEAISDIVFGLLKNMHDEGEKLVFCIDSLDGLILQNDFDKKAKDSVMPAGVPKMTKMFFRRMALIINKYDALALLTSQYSETFKIEMYAKDKPMATQGSGGNSVNHQPDWIFEYGVRYPGHYILEDPDSKPDHIKNKILGHNVTITIKKSTNEKTGTSIKIPIKYGKQGNSIWTEREVADMCLAFAFAERVNQTTIAFSPEIIKEAAEINMEIKDTHRSLEAIYKYFEQNPNICNWFYDKFRTII